MATSIEPQDQQDQQHDEPAEGGRQEFTATESKRFPVLVLSGVLVLVVMIAAIWIILGGEYAIPLVLLGLICVVAGVGFRLISGRSRDPAASEEGGLPKQDPDPSQPLGDTAEAHDEVNPHDFPLYNPGRRTAQRLAGGGGGTTRGMDSGGAAGRGGREEGDSGLVGDDESQGAQLTEKT